MEPNTTNSNTTPETITLKKPKFGGLGLKAIQNIKPKVEEPDKLFIDSINRVNESNISLNCTNNPDIDEINNTKEKIKTKHQFSLYDLEQLEKLGSGVSGSVYKLQHKQTKKLFAMKVINFKNNEKLKDLIKSEVEALHNCRCDQITRCKASFFDQGNINILLEFMDRGTMEDVLKKAGKIPEEILGIISYQILKGLMYLQSKHIVHRDLKPANILINSRGQVKISDFGVSTIMADSLEGGHHTLIGTYIYMAPERIKGLGYSYNSDIWSACMSILECAVGFFPYLALNDNKPIADVWTLSNLIDNNTVPSLPEEEFSAEFCDFIKVGLNKDTTKRPNPNTLINHPFILQYENQPSSILAKWLTNIK